MCIVSDSILKLFVLRLMICAEVACIVSGSEVADAIGL